MNRSLCSKTARRSICKGDAGRHAKRHTVFPQEFYHSVHLDHIRGQRTCSQRYKKAGATVQVRVIEVSDGRTQTRETQVFMEVENGRLKWQESGCALAVVLERHGKNGGLGYGFVTGDCLKRGAAATTYYHDHHNLMVMGANPGGYAHSGQTADRTAGRYLHRRER